jgi:hypothetical protein
MSPHARNAEIVSDHGDSGLARALHDLLEKIELFLLARAIQENIVPVGRVEVLDGCQLQPGIVDLRPEFLQRVQRPQVVICAGDSPAIRSGCGQTGSCPEVIDEVGHDVGCADLAGKAVVIRGQHVSIEAEAKVHCTLLLTVWNTVYPAVFPGLKNPPGTFWNNCSGTTLPP